MKHLVYLLCTIAPLWASCAYNVPEGIKSELIPPIFPDYADVTVPPNIAPLCFALTTPETEGYAVFAAGSRRLTIKAGKGSFRIPASRWKKLLAEAIGASISVSVSARTAGGEWTNYAPFLLHVAEEPVDAYIAYRLIEPGYELWNRMGIYQRNLENYTETPIIENRMSGQNCMNCHSFCMQNPEKMLFHMRATYPGTLLIDGERIEKLNTKTEQTIAPLVYPSWHPSGRFVAFSVNQTKQGYHHNDPNRVEVFDEASDVVVYDIEKHEILSTHPLLSPNDFETFPTFSPDGNTLYFCSAPALPMPQSFKEVRYSLCSISFNPAARTFGSVVDTLYHATAEGKSASFPRVSPNGKFLMYTLSGYGNFSIWHKDADLYMLDLTNGENCPMDILNSDHVESYHSWSSNSRWIIFSSRRIDGLYTRPYIAYINSEGKASKPFLLPQKDTDFYHRFMKSYNIPEFITGKVTTSARKLALKAQKDPGIDLTFSLR
ncbi:MAG: hypothetical protein LBB84_08185 [Tannerellaceae bacterium]|jgi:hypothetical protein|nr:hypothetical protein [Tannerellaceae bacterium]